TGLRVNARVAHDQRARRLLRDDPATGEHQRREQRERQEWVSDSFRSEEHTSELQSRFDLVCRLLLEKKKKKKKKQQFEKKKKITKIQKNVLTYSKLSFQKPELSILQSIQKIKE